MTGYESIRIDAPTWLAALRFSTAVSSASFGIFLSLISVASGKKISRAASVLVNAAGNSVAPSREPRNRTEVGLEHESQERFSCLASFFRRVRRGFVSILARYLGGMSNNMYGSE
jgi:hypothetical protein